MMENIKDKAMKANELMIGDYVCYEGENKKIAAIPSDNEVIFDGTLERYASDCSPIFLTDNILKKNGFEYNHKNFCCLNQDKTLILKMEAWPNADGSGGLWTIGDTIEIRFVHELQHVLRLCGIEKEIEL